MGVSGRTGGERIAGDDRRATLNGFVGIVAESPAVSSRPDIWSVEGGFMLPLHVRTQIDLWVSRRLAGGPFDWMIGAGVVRRIR